MIENYQSSKITNTKAFYKCNGINYTFDWINKEQCYKVTGSDLLPVIDSDGTSYLNINIRKITKAKTILREYLNN